MTPARAQVSLWETIKQGVDVASQSPEKPIPPAFAPVKAKLDIPIPNVDFSSPVKYGDKITVPFVAEYISGIYEFLLSIVGIVAGVFVLIGGFQYLTAGGSQERVASAKRRIMNAVLGLILAFGSYTLLYIINPGLLEFKDLSLMAIDTNSFQLDKMNGTNEGGLIEATDNTSEASFPKGKPKSICRSLEACQDYCTKAKPLPDPNSLGIAREEETEVIGNHPGLIGGSHSTLEGTKKLLIEAGKLADSKGYFILVTSAWRELSKQVSLICDAYAGDVQRAAERAKTGKKTPKQKSGSTIAWPGGSFHGVGYALDLQLWTKDSSTKGGCNSNFGKCVSMSGDSVGQNDIKWTAGAKTLAEIMLSSGFRRLNNEIWHFEPQNAPASSCRCSSVSECSFPPNVKC